MEEKGFADASEGITDEPSTFLLPLDGGWVVRASDGRPQCLSKYRFTGKQRQQLRRACP